MAYVKRETGYWKWSTLQYAGYSCSICHTKFDATKYENVDEFKFCPECGSKLIEVRKNT